VDPHRIGPAAVVILALILPAPPRALDPLGAGGSRKRGKGEAVAAAPQPAVTVAVALDAGIVITVIP